MYPCDPISFNRMEIGGEASYYYAEIKTFVKDICVITAIAHIWLPLDYLKNKNKSPLHLKGMFIFNSNVFYIPELCLTWYSD